MTEEEKEAERFRVVDRRRFSAEGEAVREVPAETESAKSAADVTESAAQAVEEAAEDLGGVDFSGLVISFATQAMVMMGEMPHPETNLTVTNLPAAQQTIELLAMLEEKTKGNLSEGEARLLAEMLASLRLAYVQKLRGAPQT